MEALMPAEPEADAPASLASVSFARPVVPEPRRSAPYVPGKRSPLHWTEPEKQILRDHYETRGAAYCVTLLRQLDPPSPRAARGRVYQMAGKLGLKRPAGDHAERPSAPPEERIPDLDEEIRAAWPDMAGRGAMMDLAQRLAIPRWWLSKRASALGLVAQRVAKEPDWSKAEMDLLGKIQLSNLDVAVRTFGEHGFRRTAASIMNKAKRLNISRRWTATLTAGAAAKVLGVDAKNFTIWIAKGLVKASKRESDRLAQQGGDPWSITREDLRAFILDNLEAVDIRKVDKFAFVDLLVNHAPPAAETPRAAAPAPGPAIGRYRPGLLCDLVLQGLQALA